MATLHFNKECCSPRVQRAGFWEEEGWWTCGRVSVAGWACECVSKVRYFLTLPSIDVPLSRDAGQVLWSPAPFASVMSLVSDACFVGQESSAGVRMEKAEGSSVLSIGSVLSGSTKYMFVPRVSRKGETPPVLPSEIFFWSQNKSQHGPFCFFGVFFPVGLSDVPCASHENRMGSWKSLHLRRRRGKQRRFSSSCKSEAKIKPFIFLVIPDNTW